MSRSAITRPIALIAAAASAVAAIGRRRSESPAPAEAPEEPAEILAEHSHLFEGKRLIALIAAAASAVAAIVVIGRRRSESPAPAEAPEEPAEILADNSHVFDGLYEPLYQALRNDRDDQLQEVLNEWDIRARHADNRVNRAWRELARTGSVPLSEVTGQPVRELGTRLAAVVADAGIIRDDRTSFLIGEDDKRRYRFDQEPQTGTMAEVEIPCWTAGQHVAERGIAHQSTTSTTSS